MPKKGKGGRPTKYSKAIDEKICHRLMNGETLLKIVKDDTMPTRATIYNWLDKFPEFFDSYTRARKIQADYWADEIVEKADCADDKDSAAAAKVQVDARKWIACKLRPSVYGDRANGETREGSKEDNKQSIMEGLLTALRKPKK